jgi:hypothetical protein
MRTHAIRASAAVAALAACLALSACFPEEPDPGPTLRGRFGNRLEGLPPRALFDSSLLALGLMRELSGDSYTYLMGYRSFVSGSVWREVTYRAGAPVRQEYAAIDRDGTETRIVETAADWAVPRDERPAALPEPVPLDTLYAQCRILLDGCVDRGDPAFRPPIPWFRYDDDYILFSCGCRDDRWADGYPSVELEKLRWARK